MSKIVVRTRNGEYTGDLDESDISNAIWLSLPFTNTINMLGCQIYFEFPIDFKATGKEEYVFEVGDIAYWPKVNAFCIFFGPTPLSGEDGKPVSKFPLIKIGKMTSDCSDMEFAGDRQNITIMRTF